MLTCSCCKSEKAESEFYAHPKMATGRQSRCKECTKAAARSSYRKSPEATKLRAYERERALLHRIPEWANRAAIKKIYKQAKALTETTGVVYHVDHIIPINSPLVCGLHVEDNLQILTAEENMKKRNHLLPEFI